MSIAINVPFYCQMMITGDYIYIVGQSVLGEQYCTQQYTDDDKRWQDMESAVITEQSLYQGNKKSFINTQTQ